jgi:hypothetical protein
MELFSNDVDLLKFEPGLFNGSVFAGQVLCKGANGVLNGTSFTAAGESFVSKGVEAGGVIYLQSLDGMMNAAYEIVSVTSATQLVVSVLRGDCEQAAIPVGNASGLIYRVQTFQPQAVEAMVEITTWLGLRPGVAEAKYGVGDIYNIESLHQLGVYRVMVMVFGTLYGTDEDLDGIYMKKRDNYMALYNELLRRIRVTLNSDGDGIAEKTLCGGSVRLIRE